MFDFNYHRPKDLAEASAILRKNPEGRALAGGMSLIPTMKLRLSSPTDLVDLNQISGLSAIRLEGRSLVISAMTRHADVADSAEVRRAIPALSALAEGIGDPLVRNRGTIGGSICFNDPAADWPAGLLGLGATIRTQDREIAADAFFKGLYETALKPGEIVTAISFPVPDSAGWCKFANLASRFAIVGVMVSRSSNRARVAVTGAKVCVFRVPEMEARLSQRFAPEAIEGVQLPSVELNSDLHADAEYRSHLITVIAKRAIVAAQ